MGNTLFANALVRTLDDAGTVAEAVLVSDGKIVAVGSTADLRAQAPADTKEVDLGGATLLPGFIENHNHFMSTGQAFAHVDLRGEYCDSIPEMQRKLRERAAQTPAGGWVIGRGYDQTLLEENRHPTRYDLDAAVPDHPAMITHISGHAMVANSVALKMAGLNADSPHIPGGEILRDEHGEPTGVLLEGPAMRPVRDLVPKATVDTLRSGLALARDEFMPLGISTVHDAMIHSRDEIDAYVAAMASGELPMRAYLMIHPDLYNGDLEGQSGDIGVSYGLPPNRLVAGPVKFFQDGAIQAYTASLTQPYFDQPDEYGVKIYDPEELAALILEYHKAGRQIAIHGNGDSAIDDILNGYEAALEAYPRENHRHRIEHLQLARQDQIDRMARLGVVSSVFINHLWQFGDRHLSRFLGPERALRMEPLASLTKAGIKWGLHSDCPVTEVNPLRGIWLAVNRLTSSGQAIGEEEKVSVEQALRGFGPDAAYLAFQENIMGTIAPGFVADFAVISEDPVAVPETIKDIEVLATIIDGEIVVEKPVAG